MNRDALKIFIAVGEESGDRLGAPLIRALRQQAGGAVEFAGVGGDQMAVEGFKSLFPLRETAFMGFLAGPVRIQTILRHIREAADAALSWQADVVVIIDSPEFTHRIAKKIRRAAPAIPIVDYVSPSVWAWRPGRARKMRAYVDHVLALLPFEPAAHRRLGGPACTYVGHPLSERLRNLRPNAEEQRRRDAAPPVLLVMPGSRRGEIARMLPLFQQTVAKVVARQPSIEVVMPSVPELAPLLREAVTAWSVPVRVVDEPAAKDQAMRVARAALVKSGTGTLELALAGVPMVAAYRVSAVEAVFLRHLIKVPSVILANLVLGENAVPELLQEAATPERLAAQLLPLLGDTTERRLQTEAFRRLDDIMEIGRLIPTDRAAQIVLEVATERPAPAR